MPGERQPLHHDKASALQMPEDAPTGNSSHVLVRLMDALPALEPSENVIVSAMSLGLGGVSLSSMDLAQWWLFVLAVAVSLPARRGVRARVPYQCWRPSELVP
jgi:hypothetical protein